MNISRHVCLVLVLAFIMLPLTVSAVTADDLLIYSQDTNLTLPTQTDNQTVSPGSNKYGYLNINSIEFALTGTNAEITVNYYIDSWIELLVYFLGKQDMKDRILAVINYPEEGKAQTVTFRYVDTGKAVITVSNVVMDNGDGSYWFYQHDFGTTIPNIYFHTSPSETKLYTNTKSMARGFGYFQ